MIWRLRQFRCCDRKRYRHNAIALRATQTTFGQRKEKQKKEGEGKTVTQSSGGQWTAYYKASEGRALRPLFVRAMALYPETVDSLQAVDLGCGDGEETLKLAYNGWNVLAIDYQAEALERLRAKLPPDLLPSVETRQASFEDETLTLPPADLLYAGLSLPFASPGRFPALWKLITDAIKPGGRVAVHFFGVNDAWASIETMNFHTSDQARARVDGFEIELFDEFEGEHPTATQGIKYGHRFDIIARKL